MWSGDSRLFETRERDFAGPKTEAERTFDYYDRSTRDDIARVRALLDAWFSRYPVAHRNELRARIRTGGDRAFDAATFELFLHELLVQLGYQVEVHPPVPGQKAQPDFAAVHPVDGKLYIEAVVATGLSEKDRAANARASIFYDVLNELDSRDFFLDLHVKGSPRTPPPARKFRDWIEKRIRELDYDQVLRLQTSESDGDVPSWLFEWEGWQIRVRPVAKMKHRGEPGGRAIGLRSYRAAGVETWRPIRDAIRSKGRDHAAVDAPLVIAVNALNHYTEEIDLPQALFGEEQLEMVRGQPPQVVHARNGAFIGPNGPVYRRVSAVLLARHFYPRLAAKAPLRLALHVDALRPLAGPILELPQLILNAAGCLEWIEGRSTSAVLGLSPSWPENAFDDSHR